MYRVKRIMNVIFFSYFGKFTGFVIRVTRRVSLEEQELLSTPEHPSSSRVLVEFALLDL